MELAVAVVDLRRHEGAALRLVDGPLAGAGQAAEVLVVAADVDRADLPEPGEVLCFVGGGGGGEEGGKRQEGCC
jgi:hypothetical protein